MRILSIVHGYPPTWNAGSEWMLHQMNLWFISRGHECIVFTHGNKYPEFEGVKIMESNSYANEKLIGKIADVIITHHNLTTQAMNIGIQYHKPVFYIQH
jgi:hypothetical protein